MGEKVYVLPEEIVVQIPDEVKYAHGSSHVSKQIWLSKELSTLAETVERNFGLNGALFALEKDVRDPDELVLGINVVPEKFKSRGYVLRKGPYSFWINKYHEDDTLLRLLEKFAVPGTNAVAIVSRGTPKALEAPEVINYRAPDAYSRLEYLELVRRSQEEIIEELKPSKEEIALLLKYFGAFDKSSSLKIISSGTSVIKFQEVFVGRLYLLRSTIDGIKEGTLVIFKEEPKEVREARDVLYS